jgi:hypothetical protein
MKKGHLVDMARIYLNGGQPTEDMEQKFPTEAIELTINLTILEIIGAKDQQAGGEGAPGSMLGKIATPFMVSVSDYKNVLLPFSPINGTDSIASITGVRSGLEYGIRADVGRVRIMGALRPNSQAGAYVLDSNDESYLVFDKHLVDDKLEVFAVPDITKLEDTDDIFLDSYENMVLDLIMPRLSFMNNRPIDTKTNQVPDSDGPKGNTK